MAASVLSIGGTTLEMMMPSTAAISRPAGANRFRSRMPHSSAVCSWTVRSRHCATILRPSKAPIVILLLPASRASSTNSSCKDQGIGSIVFAHHQVAGRVQPGGDAFDQTVRLVHDDPPSGGIAGRLREQTKDAVSIQRLVGFDC